MIIPKDVVQYSLAKKSREHRLFIEYTENNNSNWLKNCVKPYDTYRKQDTTEVPLQQQFQ